MVDANEIKQAVDMLDAKDNSQWEADGTPKLSVLQSLMNNPALTLDDVDEAIGAFKRGQKAKVVKQASDGAKKGVVVGATDEGEVPLPKLDLSKLDPNSPEYANAVVTAARVEDARLKAAADECEHQRDKLSDEIRALTAKRDEQITIIERYSPKISHAQAVKAIQRQTQNSLAATRDRLLIAKQVLGPTGTPTIYPSPLDAAMAARKRSPDQVKNYATFVHQQAGVNTPPV